MPESRAATDASAPDPACDARVVSLGEEERARTLAAAGFTVVHHRGRAWYATRPGFFEPVHSLAMLRADEATRPSALAWGFRAALADGAAATANATLPLHVLEDFEGWDVDRLSSRRRGKLRRSRRDALFVPLRDARLLEDEGHAIYSSHLARTRHRRIPSQKEFLAHARRLVTAGRPLVLAARVEGRLAGWIHGTAVDGVAYVDDVVVGSAFLPHQLGTGLNVEFILACGRSEGIHTVVHGLHAREDPGLDEFKEGLGFRVVHVPARVALPAPLRLWLRIRRPHVLYRLTGR
jgi:L-amino acid N-acyltransferase YncA